MTGLSIVTNNPCPANDGDAPGTGNLERFGAGVCRCAGGQNIVNQKNMLSVKATGNVERALHRAHPLARSQSAERRRGARTAQHFDLNR